MKLPKWPAMTVEGKSVTPEQASEILVRTHSWYSGCNDREWMEIVWRAAGYDFRDERGWVRPKVEDVERISKELGVLPIGLLHNRRIFSSWVGGPHGWCSWDGTIRSNNYNIGKWPSTEGVLEEWEVIAEAFPFLDLHCQLWTGETCEMPIFPVVEYRVKGGKAKMRLPEMRMERPLPETLVFGFPGYERGCDEATLKRALEIVKSRRLDVSH